MTAIAFKNGVLAADSGLFSESHLILGSCDKIAALPGGWYLSTAGNHADGQRLEAAMRRMKRPWEMKLSKFEELTTSCKGILVGPRRRVFVFEHNTGLETYDGDCFACGACEEFLMGLMRGGRSAMEAVKIACQQHALARGPVRSVFIRRT